MSPAYLEGGEPFSLGSGGAGVLALHGFTGSPFEMRELGERLHRRGFSVFAPALAGHATTESDLDRVTADDYFAAVERAFEEASNKCRRLYVVGLSLGGTLGLHLGFNHALAGIVAISTPVFLYPTVTASVPLIHQVMPAFRTPANFAAWQGNVIGYKSASIGSVKVIVGVLARVREQLAQTTAPLLVVHSRRDLTAPPASAKEIYDSASSRLKRLVLIDDGSHLLTIEPNLSLIESSVAEFLLDREEHERPEGA